MVINGEGVTKIDESARVAIMLSTAGAAKLSIMDDEGERSLWVEAGGQVTIGGQLWRVEKIFDGEERAKRSVELCAID